ncbi:hypothetical protein OD754_10750 [Rhodobacter capsulatus]|uniref:hypothetical protein n=1 Tax=Rhodobacter capsulatus TaxID=1061 RepID=UPI0028750435|nr:hypothetical protein [Rhodobacter capsulatus]MDS0927302.1 hypothetical protein [Rhodobacter capsulatus]UYE93261.1 hypothetical protein Jorvik_12 [Rhodobacter phage Jorvik]
MIGVEIHLDEFPADFLAQLPEAETVVELMARPETAAIVVTKDGTLAGYAVVGSDADGMVCAYSARALAGGAMTRAMLSGIFGAAEVTGAPLRIHASRVSRGVAMARAMGASVVTSGRDLDGVPMAIFGGALNGE